MKNLDRMKKAVANKPTTPPPLPPPKKKLGKVAKHDAKHVARGRLPDRSAFTVAYNAETQTWSGTLTIHVPGQAEPEVFMEKTTGVFKLLAKLDAHYREWLGRQVKV